jgi:hypothetical protein
MKKAIVSIFAIVGVLFLGGFGIDSMATVPGYAVVFLDDDAKTYFAPQCAEEWQHRPGTGRHARRSTVAEATRLGYKSDAPCRETGAFAEDDRSLSGLLLVKLGILPPYVHWWDKGYRTEAGNVDPVGEQSLNPVQTVFGYLEWIVGLLLGLYYLAIPAAIVIAIVFGLGSAILQRVRRRRT